MGRRGKAGAARSPTEAQLRAAAAETIQRNTVHAFPVFCVICDHEIRVPEMWDRTDRGPAHRDCARRPQRAFDLLTGGVFPAARRFLR